MSKLSILGVILATFLFVSATTTTTTTTFLGGWEEEDACQIYTEDFVCSNDTVHGMMNQQGHEKISTVAGEKEEEIDPCDVDLVATTLDLFKRGDEEIQWTENGEAVMMIGKTGTGKSTLTYFVAGNDSAMIAYKKRVNTYFIKDCNGKILDGTVSATIIPDLVVEASTQTAFYDNPGFRDTRSACVEIANNYFMTKVAHHLKKIKFAIAIDYEMYTSRNLFTETLQSVMEFVPQITRYGPGLGLVLTKLNIPQVPDDAEHVADILSYLAEVRPVLKNTFSGDALTTAEFIVDSLSLKEEGRLAVFRMPDDCGPLSDIELMKSNKKNIGQVLLNNLQFVESFPSDFNISISPPTVLSVLKIGEILNNGVMASIQMFSLEVYHYLESQFNCVAVHGCQPVIEDLKVVFDNPDFYHNYADWGVWENLNFTQTIHRITNPIFVPPNLTLSAGNLELLEKNGGYIEFLQTLVDLPINRTTWLLDMKEFNKNLKNQIMNLVNNLDQTIVQIITDLCKEMEPVYEDQVDNLVSGHLDLVRPEFQQALTNILHTTYPATDNPSLKPSDIMAEIVENVRKFSLAMGAEELSIIHSFSRQLDYLVNVSQASIHPKNWTRPLENFASTLSAQASQIKDQTIDNLTTVMDQLGSAIEGQYGQLITSTSSSTTNLPSMYDVLNVTHDDHKALLGMTEGLSVVLDWREFLSVIETLFVFGPNLNVTTPCHPTIVEMQRLGELLKYFEEVTTIDETPSLLRWLRPFSNATASLKEKRRDFACDKVNSTVHQAMVDFTSALTTKLETVYKSANYKSANYKSANYTFELQKSLLKDYGQFTSFNGKGLPTSLSSFGRQDWQLLRTMSVTFPESDFPPWPHSGLEVDLEAGSSCQYDVKMWMNTFKSPYAVLKTPHDKLAGQPKSIVYSPNVTTWGTWATTWDDCPPRTFVSGMQLQTVKPTSGQDATALNTIKLFCSPWDDSTIKKNVTGGFEYDDENWGGATTCSTDGRMKATGFQMRTEESRGKHCDYPCRSCDWPPTHCCYECCEYEDCYELDDSAANNLRLYYDDKAYKEGDGGSLGIWVDPVQSCPYNEYLCGIKSQVNSEGDDLTALNNAHAHCCNLLHGDAILPD